MSTMFSSLPKSPTLRPSPARRPRLEVPSPEFSNPMTAEIEHISPTTYAVTNTNTQAIGSPSHGQPESTALSNKDLTTSRATRRARRRAAGRSGGIFQIANDPRSRWGIEYASGSFVFNNNNETSIDEDKENIDVHFTKEQKKKGDGDNDISEDKDSTRNVRTSTALGSGVGVELGIDDGETLISALPSPLILNRRQSTPSSTFPPRVSRRVSERGETTSENSESTPPPSSNNIQPQPQPALPLSSPLPAPALSPLEATTAAATNRRVKLRSEMADLKSRIQSTMHRFRNREIKEPEFRMLNGPEKAADVAALETFRPIPTHELESAIDVDVDDAAHVHEAETEPELGLYQDLKSDVDGEGEVDVVPGTAALKEYEYRDSTAEYQHHIGEGDNEALATDEPEPESQDKRGKGADIGTGAGASMQNRNRNLNRRCSIARFPSAVQLALEDLNLSTTDTSTATDAETDAEINAAFNIDANINGDADEQDEDDETTEDIARYHRHPSPTLSTSTGINLDVLNEQYMRSNLDVEDLLRHLSEYTISVSCRYPPAGSGLESKDNEFFSQSQSTSECAVEDGNEATVDDNADPVGNAFSSFSS